MMDYAYTPGLTVKYETVIKKERRLPIKGEILCKQKDHVSYDTIVARAKLPGETHSINISTNLSIEPDEVFNYMVKKEGDIVKKGEIIAKNIAWFGLSKKFVQSTVEGTIFSISNLTGRAIINEMPQLIELRAYIPGIIEEVVPNECVTIKTAAALIQGIFGIGGETNGEIVMLADNPSDVLSDDKILSKHKNKLIVGGSMITLEALKKAKEVGVRGIIVGGMNSEDLIKFVGYEIGVAITGYEETGLTFILTEGFGKINMSKKTFEILKKYNNCEAAINGTTQIRAGVIRPEIIIPLADDIKILESSTSLEKGIDIGTPVRIIQEPHFGALGHVINLPIGLHEISTESSVRILEVELEDGSRALVPRTNVEIIEWEI